jgi:hypothetical protein
MLHVLQPIVRAWHRYRQRIAGKRVPDAFDRGWAAAPSDGNNPVPAGKRISWSVHDLYWDSRDGRGRENLLSTLAEQVKSTQWAGDLDAEWEAHDVELTGDPWHKIYIWTATEELGGPRRFTRVRCSICPTLFAGVVGSVAMLLLAATLVHRHVWLMVPAGMLLAAVVVKSLASRWRCRRAVSRLVWRAGLAAGLEPVSVATAAPAATADRMNDTFPAADAIAPLPPPARPAGAAPRRPAAANASPADDDSPVPAC